MNIKALSRIDTGPTVYQAGDFITMRDADALACIKSGAAEPSDRRARRLVAEHNAAEKEALAPVQADANQNRRAEAHDSSLGIAESLRERAANWHGTHQSRFS